jgi:hypothetical protein
MVLIIKAKDNQIDDYRRIAAQMINMETNQSVYDSDGKELYTDSKRTRRPKFNIYSKNSVEFEFTLTTGTVILYLKPSSSYKTDEHAELISEEIQKLTLPENFTETISNESGNYTAAKTNILTKTTLLNNHPNRSRHYRQIVTDPYYMKRVLENNKTQFVWLITTKREPQFLGSSLFIPELDPSIPSETYLNKSICTIVYDDIDMLNVRGLKKQLNYPSLKQYTMFSKNQILEEPIYLSWTGGLRYEIYYQFTGRQAIFNNITLEHEKLIFRPIKPDLEFKNVELKRLNPEKSWKEQLQETFDYKKQEINEITSTEENKPKFLNDVCFISKIPLWDKFYVIKIKNNTCVFDIALAPSVVHSIIFLDDMRLDFKDQLITSGDHITMLGLRICSHPRTFFQVLDLLTNRISPVKKNIMRCMELYGAYSKKNDVGNKILNSGWARNYYVMDNNTKQMYVGVCACNDTHLTLYQKTNTILFRVIVIETIKVPDLLLFPDQLF